MYEQILTSTLAIIAFLLLAGVTAGVIFLTIQERRDRARRKQ